MCFELKQRKKKRFYNVPLIIIVIKMIVIISHMLKMWMLYLALMSDVRFHTTDTNLQFNNLRLQTIYAFLIFGKKINQIFTPLSISMTFLWGLPQIFFFFCVRRHNHLTLIDFMIDCKIDWILFISQQNWNLCVSLGIYVIFTTSLRMYFNLAERKRKKNTHTKRISYHRLLKPKQ